MCAHRLIEQLYYELMFCQDHNHGRILPQHLYIHEDREPFVLNLGFLKDLVDEALHALVM